jgi:hypothetical protein
MRRLRDNSGLPSLADFMLSAMSSIVNFSQICSLYEIGVAILCHFVCVFKRGSSEAFTSLVTFGYHYVQIDKHKNICHHAIFTECDSEDCMIRIIFLEILSSLLTHVYRAEV